MAQKAKSKLFEWQQRAALGGECQKCRQWVSKLSVDHILPDWFIRCFDPTDDMRFEDEENFEMLCYVCNHIKSGRIDKFHPKIKHLILKYINL